MKSVILVVLSIIFIVSALRLPKDQLPRKNLAGPPSEFPIHDLPDPSAGAITRNSGSLTAALTASTKGLTVAETTVNLPVDSTTAFSFQVASTIPTTQYTLSLLDPNGANVHLSNVGDDIPLGDSNTLSVPSQAFLFTNPVVGVYKLTITTTSLTSEQYIKIVDPQPDLYITLWNDAPIAQYTRSMDYTTILNGNAGLVTQMYDKSANADYRTTPPTALQDIITTAEIDVYNPEGSQELIPMHDDGLHGDGAADDGIYGAFIPSTELGEYRAQAFLSGTDNEGNAFIRSTEHIIRVVPNNLQLTGTAQGIVQSGQDQMQILLGVTYTPNDGDALFAYAEVWGVDQSGNEVAVCWISGAVDYENNALPLELNLQWLAQANAKAPITLKNVYVQNNLVPISTAPSITVTASGVAKELKVIKRNRLANGITEEMLKGRRPASLVKSVNASTFDKILVHGYCSSFNYWPIADFTNALQFLDASASITNDAFANLIAQYAINNNLDSFSLIGHSQGGMASLHLHNFYWTGLELTTTGRKIQSLGTPYQGCSAAGTLADIGEFFWSRMWI